MLKCGHIRERAPAAAGPATRARAAAWRQARASWTCPLASPTRRARLRQGNMAARTLAVTHTAGTESDRFDRLEALLSTKLDAQSTKLDAQTQQIAELQNEVALLRTAVQVNAGASSAPITQQAAAAQLAPPLRSSKSSKASSSDAFLSTALQAGRTYKRGAPTADERSAVRGMHRRFSWDALNVTNANTQCGWHKCYFPSQREGEGWLVGQPSRCLRPECRDAAGQLLSPNQIPDIVPPT